VMGARPRRLIGQAGRLGALRADGQEPGRDDEHDDGHHPGGDPEPVDLARRHQLPPDVLHGTVNRPQSDEFGMSALRPNVTPLPFSSVATSVMYGLVTTDCLASASAYAATAFLSGAARVRNT